MSELINKINEARNKLKGFKREDEVNLVLTKRELEYLYIHTKAAEAFDDALDEVVGLK